MKRSDEEGQLMILTVGLALVVFAVAGLAVDGTRVFLMKRSLQNVADGAAVSAAASIDTRAYYASGGSRVVLDRARAARMALEMIASRGASVTAAVTDEEDVVTVTVRAEVRTTLLRLVSIETIPVAATSSATAFPQVVPIVP